MWYGPVFWTWRAVEKHTQNNFYHESNTASQSTIAIISPLDKIKKKKIRVIRIVILLEFTTGKAIEVIRELFAFRSHFFLLSLLCSVDYCRYYLFIIIIVLSLWRLWQNQRGLRPMCTLDTWNKFQMQFYLIFFVV